MMAKNMETRLYNGKELTEPEIQLLQYIEQEREKIRLKELERREEKVLLAKVGSIHKVGVPNTTNTNETQKTTDNQSAFQKQTLISPSVQVAKPVLPPTNAFSQERKTDSSSVPVIQPMEVEEEDLSIHKDPTDVATLLGIEKDDAVISTKIRKRHLSETENEDNIPLPTYFSEDGIICNETWDSVESGIDKELHLPSFSLENHNTIGIKLESQQSRGWAFNICPADDRYLSDILFHFNPRYKGKKQSIVMNDRQGTWGDGATEDMRNPAGILAKSIDLKVQLRKEGFLVFANGIFAAFFVHRREITKFKDLKIVFIAKDDNGKPQEVKVNQVWWGHTDFKRESLSPSINSIIQRALKVTYDSVTNPMPMRTIIAEGLPKLTDLEELQGLEYSLLDLFDEYQVQRVSLITGEGIAFIKLTTADLIQSAIDALNNYAFQDPSGVEYIISLRPMEVTGESKDFSTSYFTKESSSSTKLEEI